LKFFGNTGLDVVICNAGINPEITMSLEDGNPVKEKARGKVFHDSRPMRWKFLERARKRG
jgi:hypothetical protein